MSDAPARHPLVITRPLGGSPLARATAAGEAPGGWLDAPPRSPDDWARRIQRVRDDPALSGSLERLAPAFAATGAAAERLARSAGGRGVVVTTGQQPGLFGGPVYTWSKALSALALANALEQATGTPVAPVFWAATDDADFEEARSTVVAVPGGVDRLELPPAGAMGIPMAELPLEGAAALLDRLAAGAGSAAHGDVLDVVREAYTNPRATVGSAYVALLRRVLEPLGITVLDASHPAVRQAAHPVMLRALERASEVQRALDERSTAIREAGHDPQVGLVPELTLVFEAGTAGKSRIPLDRAAELAQTAPVGSLSPNVLLRPVAERAILPTVAYLAGPGELAYFTQVSAVADAVGLVRPVALPRWSCTIVEPHIARILERHQVTVDELAHENAAGMRLAKSAMPRGVVDTLAELRAMIDRSMANLSATATDGEDPLAHRRVTEGARTALRHRLDRLERRLVAAQARHDADTRRDLATARGALHPSGAPQERSLNFIPMLARQGQPLLDAMLAAAAAHAAPLIGGEAGTGAEAGAQARDNADG